MSKSILVIDKLSPSKIHYIDECRLRYCWSHENKVVSGLNLFNKNTFLGILIHRIIEEFINTRFDLLSFDMQWDGLMNSLLDRYNVSEDLTFIKYHIRYYSIRRRLTLELLKELESTLSNSAKSEVSIKGNHVSGTADLIEENSIANTVRIIDFKTGPIWSIRDGFITALKHAYLIQIKTYGLVYWEKGYPAGNISCVVKGLTKTEEAILTFSDEEYKEHKSFISELKTNLNESYKLQEFEKLANPSNLACTNCEFIFRCKSLHLKLQQNFDSFNSILLIEEITHEYQIDNQKINIEINVGAMSIHGIPLVEFQSIKNDIQYKRKVLVANLYDVASTNIKKWTRFTVFFEI